MEHTKKVKAKVLNFLKNWKTQNILKYLIKINLYFKTINLMSLLCNIYIVRFLKNVLFFNLFWVFSPFLLCVGTSKKAMFFKVRSKQFLCVRYIDPGNIRDVLLENYIHKLKLLKITTYVYNTKYLHEKKNHDCHFDLGAI